MIGDGSKCWWCSAESPSGDSLSSDMFRAHGMWGLFIDQVQALLSVLWSFDCVRRVPNPNHVGQTVQICPQRHSTCWGVMEDAISRQRYCIHPCKS